MNEAAPQLRVLRLLGNPQAQPPDLSQLPDHVVGEARVPLQRQHGLGRDLAPTPVAASAANLGVARMWNGARRSIDCGADGSFCRRISKH